MTPELIERVKTNMQWLAEKMPEKFGFEGNQYDWVFCKINKGIYIGLDIDSGFEVFPDDKKEFSNSIGRIYYEAFGETFYISPFFKWVVGTIENPSIGYDYSKRYLKVKLVEPDGFTYEKIELESTTELSAQLEALCIRIEQERKE